MRDTNSYNFGEARIIIPKQVFNGTTLLANITLQETHRRGASTTAGANINNATHIVYNETFTVSLNENSTWGFVFDLNVTSFTNSTFCLLDFTMPGNEFFLQSGWTGFLTEQPMHFPKAEIEILTPKRDSEFTKRNVTDLHFRFPQVWINASETPPGPGHSTIFYQSPDTIKFDEPRLVFNEDDSESPTRHTYPLEDSSVNFFEILIQPLLCFKEYRRLPTLV